MDSINLVLVKMLADVWNTDSIDSIAEYKKSCAFWESLSIELKFLGHQGENSFSSKVTIIPNNNR